MKKILLISVAALFAWAASAQDNTYRNTQTNNYRNAAQTNNYRNAAQTYNNNAAQAGNYRGTPSDYRSAVGPRVNFYTNTDDASVGIGAYYRYSFNSHWRIEPSIYVLTEKRQLRRHQLRRTLRIPDRRLVGRIPAGRYRGQ